MEGQGKKLFDEILAIQESVDGAATRLVWRKWHQLHDVLRVSLNSTVPVGVAPTFTDVKAPAAMDEDMVYNRASRERKWLKRNGQLSTRLGLKFRDTDTVDRYHHPRVGFEKGKVSFKVHIVKTNPEDKIPFKQITLWKRGVFKDAHCVLRCGRLDESKPFGFENPERPYLPLAYPGKSGTFEPLYIRVSEYNERVPFFLKVTVHNGEDNVVVVEATKVDSSVVPLFLKKA